MFQIVLATAHASKFSQTVALYVGMPEDDVIGTADVAMVATLRALPSLPATDAHWAKGKRDSNRPHFLKSREYQYRS